MITCIKKILAALGAHYTTTLHVHAHQKTHNPHTTPPPNKSN